MDFCVNYKMCHRPLELNIRSYYSSRTSDMVIIRKLVKDADSLASLNPTVSDTLQVEYSNVYFKKAPRRYDACRSESPHTDSRICTVWENISAETYLTWLSHPDSRAQTHHYWTVSSPGNRKLKHFLLEH